MAPMSITTSSPLPASLPIIPLRPCLLRLYITILPFCIIRNIGIRHDFLREILSPIALRQPARVEFGAALDDGSHLQYLSIEAVGRFVELFGIQIITISDDAEVGL